MNLQVKASKMDAGIDLHRVFKATSQKPMVARRPNSQRTSASTPPKNGLARVIPFN